MIYPIHKTNIILCLFPVPLLSVLDSNILWYRPSKVSGSVSLSSLSSCALEYIGLGALDPIMCVWTCVCMCVECAWVALLRACVMSRKKKRPSRWGGGADDRRSFLHRTAVGGWRAVCVTPRSSVRSRSGRRRMTPTTVRSRQGRSAFFGPFMPAGGDVPTADQYARASLSKLI